MRTAILPFLFIFNTQLLLIGVDTLWHLLLTIVSAVIAMLVFAAATQNYFLERSRWYESIALLLVTFALFRPGFFWDEVYPPFVEAPPAQLMELVEKAQPGERKRIWIAGTNLDGKDIRKGVLLPLGDAGPARERLRRIGLTVVPLGGEMQIAQVQFGSAAEKLGIEQGFNIVGIELPADRPAKEWVFIPALVLLAGVMLLQRRRLRDTPPSTARASVSKYNNLGRALVGIRDAMQLAAEAFVQLVHLRDEGPRDDPLPLVLIHGTSASLHTWEGWVAALKGQRRIISFDLPGFGLTGPFTGQYSPGDYRGDTYARFVLDLLDALQVPRAVVGGNSLGGEIAWRLAVMAPERVAALVLVDAAGPVFTPESVPLGFAVARLPVVNRIAEWVLPRSVVAQSLGLRRPGPRDAGTRRPLFRADAARGQPAGAGSAHAAVGDGRRGRADRSRQAAHTHLVGWARPADSARRRAMASAADCRQPARRLRVRVRMPWRATSPPARPA